MIEASLTLQDIFQAYYDCRKTKRNTRSALNFEQNLERNLMDLYNELSTGTYKISKSTVFVVEYPKVREIWAASFRDRVVHHLIYNKTSDYFIRRFMHDSYACIQNKGMHKAVDKAKKYARSVTRNYSKEAYYLKMDIRSFFVSIDRCTLRDLVCKHIESKWLRDLTEQVILHDPVEGCIKRSKGKCNVVPKHKSLFHSKGKGLPIGNLSSQFFANVYLNEVDQYIKRDLKVKRYIRYVDDLLILAEDYKELEGLPEQINHFLSLKLQLELHPNKTSTNLVRNGFDFLGVNIKPYSTTLRRSTLHNIKQRIKTLTKEKPSIESAQPIINSYLGILCSHKHYLVRSALSEILRDAGYNIALQNNKMLNQQQLERMFYAA